MIHVDKEVELDNGTQPPSHKTYTIFFDGGLLSHSDISSAKNAIITPRAKDAIIE